ncbi:radical SAM family heme chaperone HemW [Aquimarina sp. U1-2]|uniref:radical SAM family heme chaperone HemW n=1 Tax=Aquimarina sp. U1-2 TaxID=2823141 RepID=UPI001AECC7C2|nr:radical SAM family heme chaperone HemW [Aquimarina sp. U1-2]MBP2831729.1 radical SAM family heme chaperone HemW [Aquimarina sp. U1-2]
MKLTDTSIKDRQEGAGIYIHIPFCKQACHYCDFHFSTSMKKKDEIINALYKEITLRKNELGNSTIDTIYFGGGTPTVLTVNTLQSIIDCIAEHFNIATTPEITIEANPDDLTKEYIVALAKSNVNRLSIGVQSFYNDDLIMMNRAHDAKEAKECLLIAKQYFDNISIDLIYGIPKMSIARWQENIKQALDFKIPHLSCYALTVEPNTALPQLIDKGIVPPVDEELAEQHYRILADTLESKGFIHYEVSNFGKPGFFSQNNTAYWRGKSYLGIGPSAHSYNGKQRSWNVNNNTQYIKILEKGQLPNEVEYLNGTDRYNEYIMTGLRTMWGVSLEKVTQNFGETYKKYLLKQAQKHIEAHLLFLDEERLLVTKKGKFLSDGIASDLFLLNLSKK